MGAELAKAYAPARAVFAEIDEALGQSLSTLIWVGPEDQLTLTENAQPALMAVSLAVIRVLEAEKGLSLKESVTFVAGHSLGEYSALAAAGSLSLADTARLLKTRGQAMQAAVPVGEGAMAALLGADLSQAQELAKAASEGEVCAAANDNAPGQVVISGTRTAIERAVALAPKFGARRAVLLPVSAPFHCALMQPAAQVMQRGSEQGEDLGPFGASRRQCARLRRQRPGGHPRPSHRAGDRHGAVAGVDALSARPGRRYVFMRLAPAACSPDLHAGSKVSRRAPSARQRSSKLPPRRFRPVTHNRRRASCSI